MPPPTIEEELGQLERDIRQLKIEYDMFFGGGRKRPPTEIEWRIDSVIKRYSERQANMRSAQSFRFTNITQTYAKYKEIFRKKTQQKEEGKTERHFGAAAKAIEAERALKHAAEEAAHEAKRPKGPFRVTCTEPDNEAEKVERLYQAFVSAKEAAGEHTGKISHSSFREFVRKKTKDLQEQKGCRDVEYVVDVVEGQVKLKAVVKS
ncbi:MAG: hypothetical protein LAN71_13090 [Acidobacteriia bacterium]|nr:hypothetical protein [Terriglobia bacterium]